MAPDGANQVLPGGLAGCRRRLKTDHLGPDAIRVVSASGVPGQSASLRRLSTAQIAAWSGFARTAANEDDAIAGTAGASWASE